MNLLLVSGATMDNFCDASTSHGCHPGQFLCTFCWSWVPLWAIFVVLVMGATLGNFCRACASHGCNPEQFLFARASHGCHPEQFLWC